MNFLLSDEETAIVDTVAKFVERELKPLESRLLRRAMEESRPSAGLDKNEIITLQAKAKDVGLWGIATPEHFGGLALSPLVQALINLEFGRTFVKFRLGGSAPSILFHANDWQKTEYTMPTLQGLRNGHAVAISEPGGGSDVRSMRTNAIRDGGDYVINGEKMWISGGREADFMTVFARTPEGGEGTGITGFLVDREMGYIASEIPLMGRDPVALISFNDVRVPARNVIGEVNGGFKLLIDWIYDNRLVLLAPRNVGTCERLLGMAIDWASSRKTFGKFLSERENVAFWIAESEIEIRAAKLMALNGAWKATVGADYRHEAFVAKVYAARAANTIVDRVMQIHGGMGYAMEMPIQRWFRDLRIERIYEGSDEMNLAGIARNLFSGKVAPGQVF